MPHTTPAHHTPLDEPTLDRLIARHEARLPALEKLWAYYRNPLTGGRTQSEGLPRRLTKQRGADRVEREVVIENDIAWRISALERRQRIDALLNDADAIDLEAARLLTEAAVAQMDEPDVEMAVKDLRRHRPYLFRRRESASPSNAMAPRAESSSTAPVDDAAQRAVTTGDRRDLLRYLRLRREKNP